MAGDTISGYCLVCMPSDQVQPLGMLSMEEKGVATLRGFTISDLFVDSEVALPFISKDFNFSTEVNKSLAVELSVDGNLSLLQQLLAYVKGSASFKLEKNRTVTVHLMSPKKNIVNDFKLDAYINTARVNDISPTYTELLNKSQLYVITDILKCKKYTLEYTHSNSFDASIDAKAPLQGEASAGIHTANSGTDNAINDGDDYITIGVIAYQILYYIDNVTGAERYRIRRDEKVKTVKGIEEVKGAESFFGVPLQATQILTPDQK
jgi:hypothetical protein